MPNSAGFHESEGALSPETRDMHRALVSLMEELDAIDWYQQRVEATRDGELRAILAHNRGEEEEHASMLLEWIRRHNPSFAGNLKRYLFTEGSIVRTEAAAEGGDGAAAARPRAGIGSLRGER